MTGHRLAVLGVKMQELLSVLSLYPFVKGPKASEGEGEVQVKRISLLNVQ